MKRHRSVKRIFSFSSGTLNRLGIWGAVTGQLAIVPPACSIFTRAEADTVTPLTVNWRPTSPMPSSLIGRSGRRTSPAPNSVSGVTSTPSASLPKWRTFTTWAGCLKGFVKPRFGMRRMSGICPPSNPGRVWPPGRAVCPLPPRPAVLPIPEPGPRPLRMRARCEPAGGRRPCSITRSTVIGFAFALGLAGDFVFVRPPRPFPRPVTFGFRLRSAGGGAFLPTSRPLARPVVARLPLAAALFGPPPLRGQVLQRVDGRAHHVVRVGRAQALRENIAHARAFEYGAHRAARDHAGPRRGGLQEHAARAVVPHDLVRDGATRERHFHHAPARGFHGLARRLAHFVGLAGRDADPPLPIADRRSEEHTSELQSPCNLVCRLLLEKKKKTSHLV